MPEDTYDASNADGRIRLTLNNTKYVLKRPKIKEFRKLRETLIDLAKDAGADESEAEEVSKGRIDSALLAEREDEMLSWWSEVFGMLEEKDQAFPDPEDCPAWILGPTIVPEMLQAWLNRPAPPGA